VRDWPSETPRLTADTPLRPVIPGAPCGVGGSGSKLVAIMQAAQSRQSHNPTGHLTSATMGSGTAIAAGYNNRLEVASLAYGSSPALWSRQFTWQANGNLQQTTDPMYGTRQYGYDGLNRLTSAQGGGLTETYSYDAFGNLEKTGPPFSFQPPGGYNTANQPLPTADWSFDAAGNLTHDAVQGVTYTWNGDEMLSSANGINYTYDAEGNRVGKSGSAATDTIYFGGQPLARYVHGLR